MGCHSDQEASTMKDVINQSTEAFSPLASGSSGHWRVDIDESLDGNAWSMEIEGPQSYLVFQLRSLEVVEDAHRFLQSERTARGRNKGRAHHESGEALSLAKFGRATVSLIRDNEDFVRCFLLVGPRARATLRLSLGKKD